MPKIPLAERQAEMKARLSATEPKVPIPFRDALSEPKGFVFEKPMTSAEAAPFWGQSEESTREYFKKVKGVRIILSPVCHVGGRRKRKYETVLIPPSVLKREIEKTTLQ